MAEWFCCDCSSFAYYEKDGTWGIEGHGVDPDIEVIDDPAKIVDDGDPQLDAAIGHMLEHKKQTATRHPSVLNILIAENWTEKFDSTPK